MNTARTSKINATKTLESMKSTEYTQTNVERLASEE
jgi:hypothetical protein